MSNSDIEASNEWNGYFFRRVPSSGIWRRVDLVWTDVSEERTASIRGFFYRENLKSYIIIFYLLFNDAVNI
jgi:hypothetical protein